MVTLGWSEGAFGFVVVVFPARRLFPVVETVPELLIAPPLLKMSLFVRRTTEPATEATAEVALPDRTQPDTLRVQPLSFAETAVAVFWVNRQFLISVIPDKPWTPTIASSTVTSLRDASIGGEVFDAGKPTRMPIAWGLLEIVVFCTTSVPVLVVKMPVH